MAGLTLSTDIRSIKSGWNPPAPPPPTPSVPSVVTGIDPVEFTNALYGKPIPISALGKARIGQAGLVFGPYFSNGAASFGVSFGFPVPVAGTRVLFEIALDNQVAWTSTAGTATISSGTFLSSTFTARFYQGTLTQSVDALETSYFGAEAIAYRPQMLIFFQSLPLAQFGGKIPFVSAVIGDTTSAAVPADGIGLGEALERFAYSPWLEYTSSTFDTTDVTELIDGMILSDNQSFMSLLQNSARVYRSLDILQTDKLRIIDRGATVTPDITFDRSMLVADPGVDYVREEQNSVAREIELITIDPDADYVFMPSKAQTPRHPVAVTASVGKETINFPVIIDASTRASLVTYLKYAEELSRKKVKFRVKVRGLEVEPGDLVALSGIADGFERETFKVIDTSHNADYTVDITAEAILKCDIPADADFSSVVLLMHFDGQADGSTTFIDSSSYAHAMTASGNGQIDTASYVFGGGQYLGDGTGDGVTTGLGVYPEFNISPTNTDPYTIECWAYFSSTKENTLVARFIGILGTHWLLYNNNNDEIRFITSSDGSTHDCDIETTGVNIVLGTRYHIAADKDSTGKVRLYVDGVMRASATPALSDIFHNNTQAVTVGIDGLGGRSLDGGIDEVRISTVSRYGDSYGDSSFPVPGDQFADE